LHSQLWWKDLTYITQQQLDELIKRRDEYKRIEKIAFIVGLVGLIIASIFFGTQLRSLSKDFRLGFFVIGSLLIVYGTVSFSAPAKASFEKHKETMMKAVTGQFCVHGAKCDCKDRVARYLKENENINLMF
jgi:hypothetical protein